MPSRCAGLWRHPDFARLWAASTVSLFGSQVTQFAVPLVAALALDATPIQMGLLGAATTAPFLLFGLLAGVWVDRVRRRPILIGTDVIRGLLIGTIPVAAALGLLRIEQLYAVAFLVGVCTVFFDVAYQAYVPTLVERDRLVEGNGKLEVSRSLAQVAGPGLSGVLVQAVSAPLTIALDALSYVASALFLVTIRAPESSPATMESRAGLWREVGEGVGVVWHSPLLRPIAACTATWNLFSAVISALLVLYATRELGMGPALLGVTIGAGSVGALLAALVAPRLGARFGPGPLIVGGAVVGAAAYLWVPMAAAWPSLAVPLLAVAQLVGSFAGTTYNVIQLSLRQAIVPEHLQGRMNATMRFIVWGTIPLGALLGGTLGEALGLRTTLIGTALGCLAAPLWMLLSPVRAVREQPTMAIT